MVFGDQGYGNKQRWTWSSGGLHLRTNQTVSQLTETLCAIVFMPYFQMRKFGLRVSMSCFQAPGRDQNPSSLICPEE